MPTFSPEVKRSVLLDNGYDPDKYELDDEGQVKPVAVVPAPSTPDAATTHSSVTAKKPSFFSDPVGSLGATVRAGIAASPATLVGTAVSAKTPGGFLPKLATGVLSGIGTRMVQDYALSKVKPEVIEKLGEDEVKHRLATVIGNVLSGRAVQKGSGLALSLAKGVNPTAQEVGNVALSGGLGAAIPAAADMAAGRPIDWMNVVSSGLGNAVFSGQPTKLGQRLGLPVTPKRALPTTAIEPGEVITPPRSEPNFLDKTPELNKEQQAAALKAKEQKLYEQFASGEAEPAIKEVGVETAIPAKRYYSVDEIAGEELARNRKLEAAAKQEADLAARVKAEEERTQKLNEEFLRNEELKKQAAEIDLKAVNAALEAQIKISEARRSKAMGETKPIPAPDIPLDLGTTVQSGGTGYPVAKKATIKNTPADTKATIPRTIDLQQTQKRVSQGETPVVGEKSPAQPLEVPEPFTPVEQDVVPGEAAKTKSPVTERYQPEGTPINSIEPTEAKSKPSRAWFNFFKSIGQDHGVELKEDGTIVNATTGKPVAGLAMLRSGLQPTIAKVNPNKAGFDTPAHEIFHVFLDDMLNGPSKVRRNIANKAIDSFAKSESITREQAIETLTQVTGKQSVERALGKDTGFKENVRDIWANVKARFGPKGAATSDDWARLMSNKLIHDAPTEKRFAPVVQNKEGSADDVSFSRGNITDVASKGMAQDEPAVKASAAGDSNKEPSHSAFRNASLPGIASVNDAIHNSKAPQKEATIAVNALRGNTDLREHYNGMFANAPQRELSKFAPEIRNSYVEKAIEANLTKVPAKFTVEEQAVEDAFRKYAVGIHNHQRAVKLEVNGREAIDIPTWFPSSLDAKVRNTMLNDPVSNAGKQYRAGIIKHWKDNGVEEPEARYADYIKSLAGGYRTGAGGINFKALRDAEGVGLPASVREKDLLALVNNYGRRVAKDLAYFEKIQSDPEALKVLGEVDQHGQKAPDTVKLEDISGIEQVQTALRIARGLTPNAPMITAANKLAGNLMMGIKTGINNTIGIPSSVLPYLHATQLPTLWKSLSKLGDITERAYKSNAARDVSESMFGRGRKGINKIADAFDSMSSLLYNLQQGHLETFGRKWSYGIADLLIRDNVVRAKTGDVTARRFFRDVGDILPTGRKEELSSGNGKSITEDEIEKLAGVFVSRIQQSYDANDLPKWALEGAAAPFFSLARWSIGRTNNVIKNVINPVYQDGNVMPLLYHMLGTTLTGVGLNELKNLIQGKKDWQLTNKEIKYAAQNDEASKNQLAAAVIDTMQLGSFAGIAGDLMKWASDEFIKGEKARGYNMPLVSLASNISEDLAGVSSAIKEGSDPVATWISFARKVITDNVQTLRIGLNHLDSEGSARKNRFRDKGVFEKLTHSDAEASVPGHSSNPFARPDMKRFKQTPDIGEAAQALPDLLRNAVRRAEGDPDKLKAELRTLKANSYQTMPSPDRMPREFVTYLAFLRRTQGDEAAADRLRDYLKQNEVNRQKTSLVPD